MPAKIITPNSKHAKISEAQKYMLLAVLAASLCLGITMALIVHFVQQMDFNKKIIIAEDQAIVAYNNAIKTTGVCPKPKGDTYNEEELKKCNPAGTEISEIPNTLRSNILTNLAANEDLNSVPKEASTNCMNPDNNNKNYTYEELTNIYNKAVESGNTDQISAANTLMKSCSALRVIPDALPAFRNEEALLASLNKLFIDSDWQPESLSPGGTANDSSLKKGLNALSVNLSIEADSAVTMNVLHNIERSIREFNIQRATIEWSGEDTLTLQGQATAYYMDTSSIVESNKVIKPGDDKK